MDYSLILGITLAAIAITYGLTAWAHRKTLPTTTVGIDLRAAEQKVESVVEKEEDKVEAIVISAEDAAWAALQDAVAKVTDLTAAKQKVADAQAALVAKQQRVAALKNTVAALPQA
jgi:hypothetical protein